MDIMTEFREHIESKLEDRTGRTYDHQIQEPLIARKIYNWLDRDNLQNIVIDGQVFWLELVCSQSTLPKYVLNYIKRFMAKRGYKYLYDL